MYKLQLDTVNKGNILFKSCLKFYIVGNFMTVLQRFQNRTPEELESYESDQQLSQMWWCYSIKGRQKRWGAKAAVNNWSALTPCSQLNLIKHLLSFNECCPMRAVHWHCGNFRTWLCPVTAEQSITAGLCLAQLTAPSIALIWLPAQTCCSA